MMPISTKMNCSRPPADSMSTPGNALVKNARMSGTLRISSAKARLMAATAGDDYQLLFTSALPLPSLRCPVTRIGQLVRGSGIHLHDRDGAVPLPLELGWLHQ